MKILYKILLTIFFYPMFIIICTFKGIIIEPIDMLVEVIWESHDEY